MAAIAHADGEQPVDEAGRLLAADDFGAAAAHPAGDADPRIRSRAAAKPRQALLPSPSSVMSAVCIGPNLVASGSGIGDAPPTGRGRKRRRRDSSRRLPVPSRRGRRRARHGAGPRKPSRSGRPRAPARRSAGTWRPPGRAAASAARRRRSRRGAPSPCARPDRARVLATRLASAPRTGRLSAARLRSSHDRAAIGHPAKAPRASSEPDVVRLSGSLTHLSNRCAQDHRPSVRRGSLTAKSSGAGLPAWLTQVNDNRGEWFMSARTVAGTSVAAATRCSPPAATKQGVVDSRSGFSSLDN
jgi:hypothetical protein